MQPARASFGLRAFSAVALMIGFYLLASALAFGLLWLVYAEFAVIHRVNLKVTVLALVGAFAILKGCFFLSDGWKAPGPQLTKEQHPRLFASIGGVASKMGARMPDEVYLVPDVNAFVAEVGGFLGVFGGKRVMGIGLGLLSTDSIAQFEATIAHEFGLFAGGDTRLGGFLYRTRASIGRVVGNLEGSILSKPFELYGSLFLRITHAISRAQELSADAWAVRIAGKASHVEGLKREVVAGVLFGRFSRDELAPILEEGCAPANLFEGFRRYAANLGEDGLAAEVEQALAEQATDPLDTHPSLAERIAWAQTLPAGPAGGSNDLARTLLEDPDGVEQAVTRELLAKDGTAKRAVGWSDLGSTVYAARLGRQARLLEDVGLGTLLLRLANPDRSSLLAAAPEEIRAAPEDLQRRWLIHTVGCRVGAELAKGGGWSWHTDLGRPLVLRAADGRSVDPFALVRPAVEDPAAAMPLREQLHDHGLLGVDSRLVG